MFLKRSNLKSVLSIKIYLMVGSVVMLVFTIFGLTKLSSALDISQTSVFATNIPNNQVVSDPLRVSQIKQQEKIIPLPIISPQPAPLTSAAAIIVEDLSSQTILYAKDPDRRVPIASTTKIMTAMVAQSYYRSSDVLSVKDLSGFAGSTMGLKLGEKLTFDSLLYGLMLNSGNDAAYTLAQDYPGGIAAFIFQMNDQAQKLGLLNTHFDNPAGFDSPNHYSSAWDLSKIAQTAIVNPNLAKVVATKQALVTSLDNTTVHPLENVNKLLGEPGVLGIKTGYTPEAKENLVGLFERDGHKILTVVLGSEDRFGETESLVNWTYQNFTWSK